MELDEFKDLWKKHGESFRSRNEAEIAAMLNGTSKSIISKLKRSVWIELSLTIVAGLALLIYAFTLEPSTLKNVSIGIVLLFLGYTAYYIKKLSLLRKFDSSKENIRKNLENLVDNLSSYLKYYRLSYTVLYPVYFCLGVVLGGLEGGAEHFNEVLAEPKTIAILGGLALLFYFISIRTVAWLLRRLYGTHVENLKNLLNDINDKTITD